MLFVYSKANTESQISMGAIEWFSTLFVFLLCASIRTCSLTDSSRCLLVCMLFVVYLNAVRCS